MGNQTRYSSNGVFDHINKKFRQGGEEKRQLLAANFSKMKIKNPVKVVFDDLEQYKSNMEDAKQ